MNPRESILFEYGQADAKSSFYFSAAEKFKNAFWVSFAGSVFVLVSFFSWYNNFWTDRTPDEAEPTIPACTILFWSGLAMLYFFSEWQTAKAAHARAAAECRLYQERARSSHGYPNL